MTRNNLVTALGFIVLGFIALTLQLTPAQAFHLLGHSYSHVGVGSPVRKVADDCPPRATFSVERGKCVCPPGETWEEGKGCAKRPVKSIGKKKPVMPGGSGGVGGGSTDCGPGYRYDPESGCRIIKSLGKKYVPWTKDNCESMPGGGSYNPQTGVCTFGGGHSGGGGGAGGD